MLKAAADLRRNIAIHREQLVGLLDEAREVLEETSFSAPAFFPAEVDEINAIADRLRLLAAALKGDA